MFVPSLGSQRRRVAESSHLVCRRVLVDEDAWRLATGLEAFWACRLSAYPVRGVKEKNSPVTGADFG